jgi:hypothetical protein
MKNKKSQIGLIDASTLPGWILYPLMILVMLVLILSLFFMGTFAYCILKDKCAMPFGYYIPFGYHFPIWVSSYHFSSQSQECFVNNQKINCSEINYETKENKQTS